MEKLKKNRKIDIIRGYTSCGIHRDDFQVLLNAREVQVYGSQGQHRTAVLSLKLAELEVIYVELGEYPILLLDDFMSELDEKRRNSFLESIGDIQVLITCTNKKEQEKSKASFFYVKDGSVRKDEN